jgi:hypothetical protein
MALLLAIPYFLSGLYQTRFSVIGSLCLKPVSAGFVVNIFFDPEDGGDTFIRSVRRLLLNCKMLYYSL